MIQQEDITLPVANGRSIHAHLARPEAAFPAHPAVLILHEILGLNDDIRRIAGIFASEGYVALAPDIFDGLGPMPVCIVRTVANITKGEGPVVNDMLAARDWLAALPEVNGSQIGVAGFCMGGGFALLLGSLGDFKAAAPYYGDVAPRASRYRNICPVVAGYGAKDKVFGKKAAVLKAHLEELGVTHDIKVYDDAGHSYMSKHPRWMMALAPLTPMKAGYDAGAAEDSWRRMLAFFDTHFTNA